MMPNLDYLAKSTVMPKLPLALSSLMRYFVYITRAVPLVRKVNAHQGRVFLFTESMFFEGAA